MLSPVRALFVALPVAALDALAVLFPVDCAGCGASDRALCPACRAKLAPLCERRMLGDGTVVFTAVRYEGAVRHTILALKEQGRTDVARALAAPLAATVAAALSATTRHATSQHATTQHATTQHATSRHATTRHATAQHATTRHATSQHATTQHATSQHATTQHATTQHGTTQHGIELCTVPSSRAAFRRRGYDPVLLLLRKAGLPAARGVLVSVRQHAQQKALGRGARQLNLVGTLQARYPLGGRKFVLVDDVVTTGATLTEAARAIRAGGGDVLFAVALANTVRFADDFGSSRRKLVTSPDDGATVSESGAGFISRFHRGVMRRGD